MKLTGKQTGLILTSLIVGFVINWLTWLAIMRHPDEISAVYHGLLTICLAAIFVHIGDALLKAELFK